LSERPDTRQLPSIEHAWWAIDVTIFQLIFSAAALPQSRLLHRDLGASNNILVCAVPQTEGEPADWCFAVGETKFCFPRPLFKPLIIDYGTAKLLHPPWDFRTDFRHTTLRYRAPELIFISPLPTGKLLPQYTPSTDLFSIGVAILEILMGDQCNQDRMRSTNVEPSAHVSHPFMRYQPPGELSHKFEQLCDSLQKTEDNPEEEKPLKTWSRMVRKGFLEKGEAKLLCRYLWGMYYELGTPTNANWPGIEETQVWKMLHDFMEDRKKQNGKVPPPWGRGLINTNPKVRQYLSPNQINMLVRVLSYNPKDRPDPIDILQSDLFRHFQTDASTKAQWTIANQSCFSWTKKEGSSSALPESPRSQRNAPSDRPRPSHDLRT
jgi:serine/threonine protein kinase